MNILKGLQKNPTKFYHTDKKMLPIIYRSIPITILWLISFILNADAHPHVFIDLNVNVSYNHQGIDAIEIEWQFDRFSTQIILEDCDDDGNGRIDPDDMPAIQQNYGDSLSQEDFFAIIHSGEELITSVTSTLKNAAIKKGYAVFSILLDVDIPFQEDEQLLTLNFEDPSLFIAFAVDNNKKPATTKTIDDDLPPVSISSVSSMECRFNLRLGSVNSIGDEFSTSDLAAVSNYPEKSNYFSTIRTRFNALQAKYNKKIGDMVIDSKEKISLKLLSVIFLFALGYGVIHAAGPGHGKTVVMGFFLQNRAKPFHAILMALNISIVHTGTAILLSLLFMTVLASYSGMSRMVIQAQISFVVAIFILIFGIWLLIRKIRSDNQVLSIESVSSNKNMVRSVMAAGMIPCPLSITIMLLAVTQNVFFQGLLSVLGIALGMMILLSIAGITAIKAKDAIRVLSETRKGAAAKIHNALEYAGAILIICFGAGLCFLYMPRIW